MKRSLRLGLVIVAAAMHLFAPVAAYARPSIGALPGDFCSASRAASNAPSGRGIPVPAPVSNQHHCAHAPCCAGGALDAAAPPSSAVSLLPIATAGKAVPAAATIAAPVAPIIAAPPRGPPFLA